MIIAQITDFHIKAKGKLSYRVVDTAAYLARCVSHIMKLEPPPDVVLATGDLVDIGRADEYRHLRELLAPLTMPVYLIPGNHDDRETLRNEFADQVYLSRDGQFLHYCVDEYPVRLIALDTVIPHRPGGELCSERLAWLDARLQEAPQKPTIVFMHHPPFITGIRHMDIQGLANADSLGAIISRHSQVERILCGHIHRSVQVRWNGTIASTCPSSAHQVALDLRPDGPSSFVMEPPGFQLHVWTAAAGIVSHMGYVGAYAGPYPFFENGKLID